MRVLLIILLLLQTQSLSAKLRRAEIISVHDGDTVRVRDSGREFRIRLLGIDSPELEQRPWGECSRLALCSALGSRLCDFKHQYLSYEYDVQHKDKYHRDLAYIYNSRGEMLNQVLLKSGYAVVFILEPNTRYASQLKDAEAYARKQHIGIWQQGKLGLSQSPYEFRKRQSKTKRARTSQQSSARSSGSTRLSSHQT